MSIEVLGRRVAAENSKWLVHFDDVRDAAGRRVPDFLVVTPKIRRADGIGGVAVLPVMAGRVGLLKVHRHALGRPSFEVVKGFLDPAEAPAQSAARELGEEAQVACPPGRLASLGVACPETSTIESLVQCYLADGCVPLERPPVSDDLDAGGVTWFDWDAALALAAGPDMVDAVSLVCLYRGAAIAMGEGRGNGEGRDG